MSNVFPYKGSSVFFYKVKGLIFTLSAVLLILNFFGSTPFLILPSILVLISFLKWFATDDYPPVILFGLLYQWMQVSIKAIYSSITLIPMEELTNFPENIYKAYLLSCMALFFLGLGIKLFVRKIQVDKERLSSLLKDIDVRKALLGYLMFSLFSTILFKLRFVVPGLFQGIVALGYIKWALFYLVFYVAFKQKKQMSLLKIVIVLEFVLGFASYFADFKTVIFYALISFLGVSTFSKKHIPKLFLSFVFMLSVGLVWTAVKMDYREYLNQGSGSQNVNVSKGEALGYLWNSISSIDRQQMEDAEKALLDRISYIDYFSSSLSYVPSHLDFENGLLTKTAIMHVLVPRLFNPDKPAIDDSKHLTKYTGVFYADASYGVSFALGYVPDFYIDYGPVFMFLAIFLFGCLIGLIVKSIHKAAVNEIWKLAIVLPMFILLYKFENSLIKFFGNLIMFWLVALLFSKYVMKRINQYISV